MYYICAKLTVLFSKSINIYYYWHDIVGVLTSTEFAAHVIVYNLVGAVYMVSLTLCSYKPTSCIYNLLNSHHICINTISHTCIKIILVTIHISHSILSYKRHIFQNNIKLYTFMLK